MIYFFHLSKNSSFLIIFNSQHAGMAVITKTIGLAQGRQQPPVSIDLWTFISHLLSFVSKGNVSPHQVFPSASRLTAVPCPLWFTSFAAMTLLKTEVRGSFSPITWEVISGDIISCLCLMYVSMAILRRTTTDWEADMEATSSMCSARQGLANSWLISKYIYFFK